MVYHRATRYTRDTRESRRYTSEAISFCQCCHKMETISFLPVSRENLALKVLDE